MNAKEKAEELVNKFQNHTWNGEDNLDNFNAQQCALIAVDEIINTLNYDIRDIDVKGSILLDLIDYWKEVKQEIEKL